MGDALFGVEMAEAKATRFAGGVHNGTRCRGGKATFLQGQLSWLGRDGLTLLFREGREWKDVGDRWIVDGEVTQEGVAMVAGASTDSIRHFMTLVTKLLELCTVVLIHAEMEAKCLVGLRNGREVYTCSFIGRFDESETACRVVNGNWITIVTEFPT